MSSSGCFYKVINEADVPPKLPNSLSSLRRTLSADLSPSHINSSFMKRAQSSDHLDQVFGEAPDHHDQREVDDHHRNVQEKKGAFEDIWSSILSTKNNESLCGSNPPYVHPLVRRSASSLSEKSLQVCTESLGSETGSEGFGSEEFHPDPVAPEPQVQVQVQDPSFVGIYNYNECESEANKEYSYMRRAPPSPSPIPTKKSMVRSASFPPPLPSLSQSHHMRSHRRDGRLVVEAVSTPSTACLRAHRLDGRLLLTLSSDPSDRYYYSYNNNHTDDDVADDDCYPVHQGPLQNHHHLDDDDDDDDDDDVEEKVKELAIEFVMEEERASCKMIMTASKLIGSKKWEPRNFNATVTNEVAAEDEAAPPLLPPLNTSTTTALNAYEYYWRRSSAAAVVVKDANGNYNKWVLGRSGNKITAQAQTQAQAQRNVVMKEVVVGKEYVNLIPFLRGCKAKEPRRSLLFLEPYCIATS